MNLTFVPNALEKISPTWVMSDIKNLQPERLRIQTFH